VSFGSNLIHNLHYLFCLMMLYKNFDTILDINAMDSFNFKSCHILLKCNFFSLYNDWLMFLETHQSVQRTLLHICCMCIVMILATTYVVPPWTVQRIMNWMKGSAVFILISQVKNQTSYSKILHRLF
jgi:hypothetical protein